VVAIEMRAMMGNDAPRLAVRAPVELDEFAIGWEGRGSAHQKGPAGSKGLGLGCSLGLCMRRDEGGRGRKSFFKPLSPRRGA
jgi:hypothetical protein